MKKLPLKKLYEIVKTGRTEGLLTASEAYALFREIDAIHTHPAEIAMMINNLLRKRFSNISFFSTAPRVSGLEDALQESHMDALEEALPITDYRKKAEMTDYLRRLPNYGWMNNPFADCFQGDPNIASRIYYPFFEAANEKAVVSESEFGMSTLDLLRSSFDSKKGRIPKEFQKDAKFWNQDFLFFLSRMYWTSKLSKPSLTIREMVARKAKLRNPPEDLFKRMEKANRVLDDQDKMTLLYHWLDSYNISSYSTALRTANMNAKTALRKFFDAERQKDDFSMTYYQVRYAVYNFLSDILSRREHEVRKHLR